jgi:hypothetical protein
MSVRVTKSQVEEIIDIDSSITDISAFITAANTIINATLADTDLTEAVKTEIERWLSAHFVAIRDQRAAAEKAGSVSVNYQYKLGTNLQCTMYGQQACMIDTTGILAGLSNGKGSATIGVITPDLWD